MKTNIILLAFLMLLLNKVDGQNYYELANKEYFFGDLNKAMDLFTKAIVNNQETSKSYMYRGAAKSFLNLFIEAKLDLDSSRSIDSLNGKLYYYYGKLYLFQRDYKNAIKHYDIAILKNAKDAPAYDERAVAKTLIGDFSGAIIDENKAIFIDSTKQIYYTDRGFAKLKLKNFKSAIQDFSKSLQIDINQKAYANRGYAYSLIGNHLQAIKDYSKSLELNPTDAEIYYYRGLSYKSLNKTKEACGDFEASKGLGYLLAKEILNNYKCK